MKASASPGENTLAGWAWRVVLVLGVALLFLATHAWQAYVPQYQTLPFVDFLESQPPLNEASAIPAASVLAGQFAVVEPEFGLGGRPEGWTPSFERPGIYVRSISGVRDAASLLKQVPDARSGVGLTTLRLRVAVFYRAERAQAWADLRTTQLDLARVEEGQSKPFRTSPPTESDVVWVGAPGAKTSAGSAIVVGFRGPIAFEVETFIQRDGTPEDLGARAETLARRASTAWLAWLESQRIAGVAR